MYHSSACLENRYTGSENQHGMSADISTPGRLNAPLFARLHPCNPCLLLPRRAKLRRKTAGPLTDFSRPPFHGGLAQDQLKRSTLIEHPPLRDELSWVFVINPTQSRFIPPKVVDFTFFPIQRRALLYFEIWCPWISWTCLRSSCCPLPKDNRSWRCPATDHNTSRELVASFWNVLRAVPDIIVIRCTS
jgi:hypothetical protein